MHSEVVLPAEQWRRRAEEHAARIDALLAPHLQRRREQVAHPVHDFLFTYYSQRPARLRRWHPGAGVRLADAEEYADLKGYRTLPDGTVGVDPAYVEGQGRLLGSIHRLLVATAGRAPQLGCFGLHEWAMVYRMTPEQTRHSSWPLRLGPEGTDRVVESHRIGCSHFDAFRFFTAEAAPRNTLRPARDDREAFEQPGCLHATMDLYKHAFRLTPLIPSELVADCFELARDVRILDMRAAPYDLSGLEVDGRPFVPVRIETPEGKREYADTQRAFSERAAPIRQRLIEECARLVGVSEPRGH